VNVFLFLLALILGICAGKTRAPRALVNNSGKALTILIYALLFVVGIEVGGHREALTDLKEIGLQSTAICVGAVLGSGLFSRLAAGSGDEEDGA